MISKKTLTALGLASCFLSPIFGEIKLGQIFQDNMVVQRNTEAPFWGWGDSGEHITITTSWGEKAETVTKTDGTWRVRIKTPAAGGPHTIHFKGNNQIQLNDVLSGEVWFCSGQSNMQMAVRDCWGRDNEKKNADYPQIRLFEVKRAPSNPKLDDVDGQWAVCSAETVLNFSATAYFFGRGIHQELNVPVGLIVSSWGATTIEAWTARESQLDDPVVKKIKDAADQQAATFDPVAAQRKYDEGMKVWEKRHAEYVANGHRGRWPNQPPAPLSQADDQHYPGNLYNGMVHPILGYAIRGAIWYQGESNSKRASNYEKSLKRLITTWREAWGQGDFPFYFVQLPEFKEPWVDPIEYDGWPILREAYRNTAEDIPNTGMAIALGLGAANDIHPKNKQGVGDRLARLALRKTYNKTDHAWTGPIIKNCSIEGGQAIITFENGNSPLAIAQGDTLYGFALADKNGKVVHANARISGEDTVIVASPQISNPVSVFYAYAFNPEGANLANEAGLSASPFKVGELPEKQLPDFFSKFLPEEANQYQLLYSLDPTDPKVENKTHIIYAEDNHQQVEGPFRKVAYFLALEDGSGKVRYAFVSMDPISQVPGELGVPVQSIGRIFQQEVSGVEVKSNVAEIQTGHFESGFNIEFWCSSYGPQNSASIPNGSNEKWDFADRPGPDFVPGYGCMQIHNYAAQQSVICFNKFGAGKRADVGIGNSGGKSTDWTQSSSARHYKRGELKILVLK